VPVFSVKAGLSAEWIYPFPGSNLDGIPTPGIGATSDDSPLFLDGGEDEATVACNGYLVIIGVGWLCSLWEPND